MRSMAPVLPALLAVLGFAACGEDDASPPESPYSDALTHPDSLIHDLMASYTKREIQPYANLLARDFRFFFLEDDITPEIPLGYWNHEEDSTGTRGLFQSKDVVDIRVSLTWDPPEDVLMEGMTVQRVFVSFTDLDVDQKDGVTLQVNGDHQYFYFRPGVTEIGEDPGRLYLWWWEDLGQEGRGPSGGLGRLSPLVETASWGNIKKAYE